MRFKGLENGDIIDARFAIERKLASGGRAWIYLAHDIATTDVVAVKVPRYTASAKELQRGTHILARCQFPGVVKYRQMGTLSDGRCYLVTDWIDGPTVYKMLCDDQLPIADALTIAKVVANVLAAVHAAGYMHRDIKPLNVIAPLLEGKPCAADAQVIDFDLALPIVGDESSEQLMFGKIIGTPIYMAPEQLAGRHLTPAVDVFALGAMMFSMLYGQPLGGNADDLVKATFQEISALSPFVGPFVIRRLTEPVRLPDSHAVPESVQSLLLSTLQIDPRDRPSAKEVAEFLHRHENKVRDATLTTYHADQPRNIADLLVS